MVQIEFEMNEQEDNNQKKPEEKDGMLFWRTRLKSSRYILAPMVDHSELSFRMLVRQLGVQCTYTPMFNAKVFVRNAKYRDYCLQISEELDRPYIIQFCASNPEDFAKSAKMVENLCDGVDLNLGCPQHIARRGHYGAFLQDEWPLVSSILSKAVSECNVPITCKIRVFSDVNKTVEYAKMLEQAGVSLIGVHGRTREQKGQFQGLADWEQIKAVKQNVRIPVFANGNIQTVKDAERCLQETGADGVMSAEGLLYNPALFHDRPYPVWEACEEYLRLAKQFKTPPSMVRGHMFNFFHQIFKYPQHEHLRTLVGAKTSYDDLKVVGEEVKKHYQQDYEQFAKDFANRGPDQWLHPDEYPDYCCKPCYRHSQKPSTENLPNTLDAVEVEQLKQRKRKIREERKQQRMESKKLKISVLCTKCLGNQRGQTCAWSMCKRCCKAKTDEEKVDCEGHRRKANKGHAPNETSNEEPGETSSESLVTLDVV